jgi:putative ABC transport system permease protein
MMLKNNLKSAWRSLIKNKVYTIINSFGLAVGIAAFLLITLYARYELNYDKFHENRENLYRVVLKRYDNGELSTQWACGAAGIGPALKENFAEVDKFVKLHGDKSIIQYRDRVFKEERTHFASESFFKIFSIKLIQGIDSLVLKEPYSVVLSESTARKYFGDKDPVGETIKMNGRIEFNITGIYEDIPKQSHMEADMLYSFESYVDLTNERARTAWDWDGFYTYVLLYPGTDAKELESKLPDFVINLWGEAMSQYNTGMEFLLQPITDIHLYSDYMYEMKPNGDGKATYFLLIIGVFIIIIAWVNYVNLSTAKSMDRAREVGIRKILGSLRHQLARQFLVESFLLNFIAMFLAILFLAIALPRFNQFSGLTMLFPIADGFIWIIIILIFIFGGFLSGIYPALVLSGFQPNTVLKGDFNTSSGGTAVRKSLVVFQFIASLVLMVGTLTVFEQLRFMKNQDLGVNIEQTLIVNGPNMTDSLYNEYFLAFKNSVGSFHSVSSVASSTAIPGSQPYWNAGGIRLLEQPDSEAKQYRVIGIDGDFIDAYGLELVAGRKFDKEHSNEQGSVIFNESAIELLELGQEEALGRRIFFWGDTFEIVGVLKNYHQESLKKSFEPLIFRYFSALSDFYSIKIRTDNIPETIKFAEDEWHALFPGNPFEYFFLDDHFNDQYNAEQKFGKVFGIFAILAIFIASLGLFGLASYMTKHRTKEIGIRKVLGASVPNILRLLTKDFSLLIVLASVFAIPISWYIIYLWLQDFANKINISWPLFLFPVVALLLITLATVSFQTIKTALINPVECLRDE